MQLKMNPKKILWEKFLGVVEYYRHPELKISWGGPFNGQTFRQLIFRDLIETFRFSTIVETGTYRGTTTEYLQKTAQLPVYTVEHHPRYFGFVMARFLMNPYVKTYHGDSRSFLRDRLQDPIFKQGKAFFYLDAHWGEDIPLVEEIQIIFESCPKAVVMIDDFKVPFDEGYEYERNWEGKFLRIEYIAPLVDKFKLSAFFPALASKLESGAKRGCVVLAQAPDVIESLRGISTLVPLTPIG